MFLRSLFGRARRGEPAGSTQAPPGIELAFDIALRKLEEQRHELDQLDTKAAAMIGALGVVTGGYVLGARTTFERVGGGILLALAIMTSLYGYLVRQYANAPLPSTLAEYAGYSPDVMRTIFLEAVLEAFDSNRRQLRWKVRSVNISFLLVGALALFIIATIVFKLDPRL